MHSEIHFEPIGVRRARTPRPALGWSLAILGVLLVLQTFLVITVYPDLIPAGLVGGVIGSLMIAASSALISPYDS